ncbi:hypothetical protein BH20ACT18_BH20ACT18_03230 [soil metagenome]
MDLSAAPRYGEGVATAERIFTAEEFVARPEDPLHRRVELIDGRIVMDDPRGLHQHVVVKLLVALNSWISGAQGRGLVIFNQHQHLTDRDVLSPDLLWWADTARVDPQKNVQPVADLVVEVRSPATWKYDIGVKRRLYEEHGAGELWLVDTSSSSVIVCRRSEPDAPRFDIEAELSSPEPLTSPALSGFELAVEHLFRFP